MSDKTREVYAEKVNTAWINPFVEFKLRLSEVNRINKLIDRAEPKPIERDGLDAWASDEKKYCCPTCKNRVWLDDNFCKACGQALDTQNIAF